MRAKGIKMLNFLSIFIAYWLGQGERCVGGGGEWSGHCSFSANHCEYFDIQFKSIKWLFAYQFLCLLVFLFSPTNKKHPLPPLLRGNDPFTKAIVALLLFMATNNLGTGHSELFMHGQYVTVASFVVIASYAKRTPTELGVGLELELESLRTQMKSNDLPCN